MRSPASLHLPATGLRKWPELPICHVAPAPLRRRPHIRLPAWLPSLPLKYCLGPPDRCEHLSGLPCPKACETQPCPGKVYGLSCTPTAGRTVTAGAAGDSMRIYSEPAMGLHRQQLQRTGPVPLVRRWWKPVCGAGFPSSQKGRTSVLTGDTIAGS